MKATSPAVLALLFATQAALACDTCGGYGNADYLESDEHSAFSGSGPQGPMFGVNPGSTSNFIWRGKGEAWEQSSGYSWEWTGVHDQAHKSCKDDPNVPEGECEVPPEIEIEKKKNLARSCIVAVDDDYYYTKTASGLNLKIFREYIEHDIDAITYANQQIVYDVSRSASGA